VLGIERIPKRPVLFEGNHTRYSSSSDQSPSPHC
jgi:hypothetical protein